MMEAASRNCYIELLSNPKPETKKFLRNVCSTAPVAAFQFTEVNGVSFRRRN
jgi:hypothetical protein